VAEHVIGGRRDGSPAVQVVWGRVLAGDTRAAAETAAAAIAAPGVQQYWDADMALGRALGEQLDVEGPPFAWDVYLFYETDATWDAGPPNPMAWVHQMGGVAPGRFHAGAALDTFLHETVVGLPIESAGDAGRADRQRSTSRAPAER
jgi:hypothetical protein